MRTAPRGRLRSLVEWGVLVLLAALLTIGAVHWSVVERLDSALYDTVITLHGHPARDDIVIVAIDDQSLDAMGRWPWPRRRLADLLARVGAAHPRGIGVDILFIEPDLAHPEDDHALAAAVAQAGHVILPALPERLSETTRKLLDKLDVEVLTNERVTEVGPRGLKTASGHEIPSEITVWAAGIKAPEFLAGIAGLETNRINQLAVNEYLQTTLDPRIYALGDCAACRWEEKNAWVPPRAQAAHQQASHLLQEMPRIIRGQTPRPWRYRDFGSLVSLGDYSTIG